MLVRLTVIANVHYIALFPSKCTLSYLIHAIFSSSTLVLAVISLLSSASHSSLHTHSLSPTTQVCDAKPILRKILMDKGDALAYFEPESLVMSRTGDEVRVHAYCLCR